jgi:hypothetical protein
MDADNFKIKKRYIIIFGLLLTNNFLELKMNLKDKKHGFPNVTVLFVSLIYGCGNIQRNLSFAD